MIIQLHTPKGIIDHELTAEQLKSFASRGDPRARKEIFKTEIDKLPKLSDKIDLLAWAACLTDRKPQP